MLATEILCVFISLHLTLCMMPSRKRLVY